LRVISLRREPAILGVWVAICLLRWQDDVISRPYRTESKIFNRAGESAQPFAVSVFRNGESEFHFASLSTQNQCFQIAGESSLSLATATIMVNWRVHCRQ
jgi:hypothetical protein